MNLQKKWSICIIMLLIVLCCSTMLPIIALADTNECYSITYYLDGGTNAIKNPDVYTDEDTITLMDASKVGYDFAGWFVDAEMTEAISVIANRTNDLNLYAKFTPKTYSAIFNDNGATKSTSLTLNLNTVSTFSVNNGDIKDPYSISIPQKNGYVFLGWYNGENLLNNPIEMDTNLTLTPKWSYCTQNNNGKTIILGENATQVFQSNGYSTILDSSGATTTCSTNPTYIYISGGYQTIQYEGTSNHQEWGASGYYQAGETYGTFSIYDVTNSRPLVSVPVGYNGSRTQTGTLTIAPGTLLRISATSVSLGSDRYRCSGYGWISTGEKRTVNISVANSRTADYEFESYINTPSVSKTGYKFLGWYDSQGNQMTDTWQYTTDQTFTAKWQPQDYDIIYELDGGTNSPSNPNFYTIEDAITLKAPTKPGYTFKGWYSDSNFTTRVTSISKKTGNITLYAKWEVNSYNLTLDANTGVFAPKVTFISDGTAIKSCYLYGQDTITAYRPDDKDGYIFAGWYTDDTFTSLFKFNGTIVNDITLYAKWVECNSNIVNIESVGNVNTTIQGKTEQLYAFVPLVDGKITVSSESNNLDLYGILYDASNNVLTSADDISSTDLDFTYTYSVKAGQLCYISVKGNTASTAGQAVINIGWTGNCTITGTTYQNRQLTVVYDTNYKLPQKPVREGYVFLGWFDENDTQITDGKWNFVTDKTLTAKWEEATYHTVTFKDANGNVISSETYYLSEDIVAPEVPTKAPDEIYIYHAKWDNGYTGVCTGDAVYSPTYDAEFIEYTVIFADEDGTELSKATYHWGDAVASPAAPTKEADNAYTYTFAGWDKTVVNCAGNATYTATYNSNYIDYTVVFKNWNGTVLSTKTYHYGDKVTAPANPTKAADNTYAYTFAGWDKPIVNCAGNVTYIATYNPIYINYRVVFKNWDGTILSKKTYHWGEVVTKPGNPTKAADNTYTYTFAGWDKTVVNCAGDATYTATYDFSCIDYTVVFKNWDGTILSTTTYHWGDRVTAPANPTKAADNVYTYTFAGWDKTVVNCAGNVTYTAVYEANYIDYTVVFEDWDGTVLSTTTYHWGDKVTAPANPTKAADNTYTYTFAGWNKNVVNCAGNATYTATYNSSYINYRVVFKNWNGTNLSTKTYHWGDRVTAPANPTKAADNVYTYTFAGWDKTVVNCAGNATYTATYDFSCIDYTVVFKNWDGTILSTTTYHWGDRVTAPVNPTKAADDTYTYTFAGWDKEVVACAGEATYTAVYTSTYIDYTVVFKDWDGTVLSTKTYHWGDRVTAPVNPTKAADNFYTYTFAGWDNEVTYCTSDTIYIATYDSIYIDYTVVFKNWDGSILASDTYHYGDAAVVPADPIRDADDVYTYTFAGWDKMVVDCAGDATYTAVYTPTYIDYTVVFKDWDGAVLSTTTYHWGDAVTAPTDLTKAADNTYTYAFAGWDKEVIDCAGNATYTAVYTAVYIDYTVVFKHLDGTVIATQTYHWGDTVTAPENPTKATDDTYIYTFAGWDREIVNCAGDATYTAYFTATHYHTYGSELVEPTCTEQGYTIYACACGDTYEDNYTESVGHTYANACDTDCDVCGNTRTVGSHKYTNNADTTCDHCGAYAYPGGNTLVKENGVWYHVIDRQKVSDTTLVYYGGYWFYIKDGVINYSNTLCKWNGMWFHVKDGKVVYDTTLVSFGGYWFYVKDGKVDFNATTLCYFGSAWYYVKGGQVNYSNTLCSWNGKWWHVKDGKVVYDTTLVYFANTWYYVKSGVLNYSNTLCNWNGKWWHVKDGNVVYDTTLVNFAGDWYYVKSGVLNYSNTLCNWNGKWYHVKDGTVVYDTTLVYFGSNWYCVRNGVVDFNYSGEVLFAGTYYTVKNGVKV